MNECTTDPQLIEEVEFVLDAACSRTSTCRSVAYRGRDIKGFIPPKLSKLDLTTDAEYDSNLVNVNIMVVNVQTCSLLCGYMLCVSTFFLTDISGF